MKPPTFGYPGSKAKLAPKLVALMPRTGRVYFEPFVGRGNVFFCATQELQYKFWHINDIQHYAFFSVLRWFDPFVSIPYDTKTIVQIGKNFREQTRNNPVWEFDDSLDPVMDVLVRPLLLLEPHVTFSGGGYKAGARKESKNSFDGFRKRLHTAHEILRSIPETELMISGLDWHVWSKKRFNPEDLIYVDPPYMNANPGAYDTKNFDHVGLVKWLKRLKARWMLSEYKQDIYMRAFGSPLTFPAKVSMSKNVGQQQRDSVECVWKNF
jgi:site-specific DNA-adenine methylase